HRDALVDVPLLGPAYEFLERLLAVADENRLDADALERTANLRARDRGIVGDERSARLLVRNELRFLGDRRGHARRRTDHEIEDALDVDDLDEAILVVRDRRHIARLRIVGRRRAYLLPSRVDDPLDAAHVQTLHRAAELREHD